MCVYIYIYKYIIVVDLVSKYDQHKTFNAELKHYYLPDLYILKTATLNIQIDTEPHRALQKPHT